MKISKLKGYLNYITFLFFITFFTLVGSEYSFRIALLIKKNLNGLDNTRTSSKILDDLYIAFDGKYSKSELNNMTPLVQGDVKYKDWIIIGNADHKNLYSEVIDGKRRTIESTITCKNPIKVWFFGGSTTYGVGVPYTQTIPSKFVNLATANNICIKAENYGVPYHYSLQESIFISSKLAKGEMDKNKPDFIFLLDGLNDFLFEGPYIRQESALGTRLSKLVGVSSNPFQNINEIISAQNTENSISFPFKFNSRLLKYVNYKIRKKQANKESKVVDLENISNLTNKQISDQLPIEKRAKLIAYNMYKTRKYLSIICKSYSINCIQFIQPVPMIHYKPLFKETLTTTNFQSLQTKSLFMTGYTQIRKDIKDENYKKLSSKDLSKLFLNYKNGIPYVDSTHYSPRANQMIAKEMLLEILPIIRTEK